MPALLPPLLDLAERVATVADRLEIRTALIGALALAANGYVRGTLDADLATTVDPFTTLRTLAQALEAIGLHTRLIMPDATDPLGGILRVWEREDEDGDPVDYCEVVNFTNPWSPGPTPAHAAIATAVPFPEARALRYVTLPSLVALKVATGALRDRVDVIELLASNPETDLDELRRVASPFDEAGVLETLIADAAELHRRGHG